MGSSRDRTILYPSLCYNNTLDSLFPGHLGKTALDGLTVLDFNEARYDVVAVASCGPYGSHLQLASDR